MPAILLAVTAASAASAFGPTISAVTPYRIPVDGLTQVTVTGSGFTAASASTPTCRISTFRYITPWYAAGPLSCQPRASLGPNPPGVSFDKPSPTNYTAPATIINDPKVREVYLGQSFGEGITEEEEKGLELD